MASPLRSSSFSSKSGQSRKGLDPLKSSRYSPAPNLILQPCPASDVRSFHASGGTARFSTMHGKVGPRSSNEASLAVDRAPVYGSEG
ncbi:hypothetical protein EC968_000833 [Mortierella alpina]|nr:hypothetical protein EC968_000833 [Mortierella alpina]